MRHNLIADADAIIKCVWQKLFYYIIQNRTNIKTICAINIQIDLICAEAKLWDILNTLP